MPSVSIKHFILVSSVLPTLKIFCMNEGNSKRRKSSNFKYLCTLVTMEELHWVPFYDISISLGFCSLHEFDANSFRRSLFPTISMPCTSTTFGIANLDPITFGKI